MALVVKILGNNSWKYNHKSGTGTLGDLWFSIFDPAATFGSTYTLDLKMTGGYHWNPARVTGTVQASSNGFQTVYAQSTLERGAFPLPVAGVMAAVPPVMSVVATNDVTNIKGTDDDLVTITDTLFLKNLDEQLSDTTLHDGLKNAQDAAD